MRARSGGVSEQLNEFIWHRPKLPIADGAIKWRGPSKKRELLVRELRLDIYEPLKEHPTLFRIFADMELTEASFLSFVHRFGFLVRHRDLNVARGYHRAAFFDDICYYHRSLKSAISRFDSTRGDALLSADVQRLRGDVNYNLEGRWNPDAGGVSALVVWKLHLQPQANSRRLKASDKQELNLVPHSLIAAMWLQLAQEMTGNYRVKRCLGCRNWFKAGDLSDPLSRRSDAELCGDPSCKMRAIRNREKAKSARNLGAPNNK